MILSVVLSIGLQLTKMILKYQSEASYRQQQHDETSERKGGEDTINLKPDDFLRAEYEHMIGSSGLMETLQILKGLEAEGPLGDYEAVLGGLLQKNTSMGTAKDIATQMAGVQPWLRSESLPVAVWQPITRARYHPFC